LRPRATRRRAELWSLAVSRTRLVLTLLAALAAAPVWAGPALFKKKIDSARAEALIAALRSDPDEKKRRAAADELGGADSRLCPEVATALVAALRKDASPTVRAEAAESLSQLGQVFPVAGQALEAAASGDPSIVVRLAAKRTLWEYHLNGYRSPKGSDGFATQTVEPPIASPAGPRPAMAVIPAPPPPPVSVSLRPSAIRPGLPPAAGPGVQPPVPQSNLGPRPFRSVLAELFPGPRLTNRAPLTAAGPPAILNLTHEPPVAKRSPVALPPFPDVSPVPPPTVRVVPPPPPPRRPPDYVPTLPFVRPELPSVVLPPDAELPRLDPPAPPPIPATLPPVGEPRP
jgi:hypothetical protein